MKAKEMNKIKRNYLLVLIARYGSLANLSRKTGIPKRSLENWKYGKSEMPDYIFTYLNMYEDKITLERKLTYRIHILKEWLYCDNSICKEDIEYLDYELSYMINLVKGCYDIQEYL